MARETVTREIGGETFRCTPLPATKGWALLIALGRLLGAPVGRAAGAAGLQGLLDSEVGSAAVGKALEALAEKLDEDRVSSLTMRLLESAEWKGERGWVGVRGVFDVLFMGRYVLLLQVLGFALEVNFDLPLGDLLASAARELGAARG